MNKLNLPVSLFAIVIVMQMLGSCSKGNSSLPQQNPYPDDYSEITPLSKRNLWGAANVHDPSIIKVDSFYYVYSTDAYYHKEGVEFNDVDTTMGQIPIRRSKDLVNWEFVGWALKEIPSVAIEHVHRFSDNKGADNIWAPYILKVDNIFRLYYSVSCFGTNASVIGLAESASPAGPWTDKGIVTKTDPSSVMNAIDPSVITDASNGRMWMHYGSYFGGLFCVELNPSTGLPLIDGDQGHLIATRADKKNRIIEAPEIVYNPVFKKYYLFVSYDPLFTFYNIRVGRSDSPEGPFFDFFGNNMADSTNNFPILTHSYMFDNHLGWSGNGHCSVFSDEGQFYMLHQGRLAPENLMMVMHVRQMKWLSSGWPVVSPERFVGNNDKPVVSEEIAGEWEIIHLRDIPEQNQLWQGQIPPGGWHYNKSSFNTSQRILFGKDNHTNLEGQTSWQLTDSTLMLGDTPCVLFRGWDWENERSAILFSGITNDGATIWGKKVNSIDSSSK